MAECASPSWLNNMFLETALRTGEGDPSVKVTSSDIKPATVSGDNYLSIMYRVTVQVMRGGRKEEKSLIVKTEPTKEEMLKIVSNGDLFYQEAKMYRDVIPALYSALEEVAPGQYQPFGAKCLYSHNGSPATVLVLEDLKQLKFTMAERTNGLDMDHCLLVMRKLAHFHAASLVLYKRHPEVFKPYMRTIFCEKMRNDLEGFFTSTVRKLAKEVKTWPEYSDRFADEVEDIADNAMSHWIKALATDDGEFKVLNHGDLWVNNIMFRYSEDASKVEGVRFVDYQLSYWTSPAVDLHYFLNSSPAIDIADKLHVFVEEYHTTLGETLAMFGYQNLQPSLEYLNEQLDKRGTFGVVAGIAVRTVVLVDRECTPDMEKILKEEETMQFSETYKKAIKKMLPFYEKKGWL